MDTVSKEIRSKMMASIKSKDTKPEITVRKILHQLGYRFRLHKRDLPGRPDIVLPKHHKIILVQGCFWHGHNCAIASSPKSNNGYWQPKIAMNRARDARNKIELEKLGWRILELWECDIRNNRDLLKIITQFMAS